MPDVLLPFENVWNFISLVYSWGDGECLCKEGKGTVMVIAFVRKDIVVVLVRRFIIFVNVVLFYFSVTKAMGIKIPIHIGNGGICSNPNALVKRINSTIINLRYPMTGWFF